MLLIAQPKSASTALINTLGKILKMEIHVGIPANDIDIPSGEFETLQLYHNNMIERGSGFFLNVSFNKKIFYKEHILPTYRHLRMLDNCVKKGAKYVILLRNPEDSTDNYKRLLEKNNKMCPEKELLNDLTEFNNRYKKWAENRKNVLVVYYDDLILDYKQTMSRILTHYGYKRKTFIDLLKRKYTGVGEKRLKCY